MKILRALKKSVDDSKKLGRLEGFMKLQRVDYSMEGHKGFVIVLNDTNGLLFLSKELSERSPGVRIFIQQKRKRGET